MLDKIGKDDTTCRPSYSFDQKMMLKPFFFRIFATEIFNLCFLDNCLQINMNRSEVEEKVNAFLVDELEIDEEKLKPEALLKEHLGIDSLDFVDIVVIVEKQFGFKIKPEEMKTVKTLDQFYDYIASKVA